MSSHSSEVRARVRPRKPVAKERKRLSVSRKDFLFLLFCCVVMTNDFFLFSVYHLILSWRLITLFRGMLRFFFFTFLLGFPGAPVESLTLMLSLNSKNVNVACLL